MLSKSLIQFSVDGQDCVPTLLFDLRSNYGGDNEDNSDLLWKVPLMHCSTQYPRHRSRPPLTHASARDSWTLTGKSGSVSCGVTVPFSWVMVHTRFCLCPPRVCFPVLWKFGSSIVGLMMISSKRAYDILRSAAPRVPAPAAGPCWPVSSQEAPLWLSSKESTCQCRRHGFNPWVKKIPWRRKWQPTPVFLPGKYHGQRSLEATVHGVAKT